MTFEIVMPNPRKQDLGEPLGGTSIVGLDVKCSCRLELFLAFSGISDCTHALHSGISEGVDVRMPERHTHTHPYIDALNLLYV